MLSRKFYAASGNYTPIPLPGEDYYGPTARTATAAPASVTLKFGPNLVISKGRNVSRAAAVFDSVRQALKRITPTSNAVEVTDTNTLTSFDAKGFSVGADTPGVINSAVGAQFVTWSFKSGPGFLDILTYAGDGAAGRQLSHNLGVAPTLAIAKSLNVANDWAVCAPILPGDLYWNLRNALVAPTGTVESRDLATPSTGNKTAAATCQNGLTIIAPRSNAATADFSTDGGLSWQTITLPATFACVTYSPVLNLYVASANLSANSVYYSANAQTWTQGTAAENIGTRISWCNDAFLAVVGNSVWRSVNGQTWTKFTDVLPSFTNAGAWGSVCFGNGVYVTVSAGTGGISKAAGNRCRAAYSSDGMTWSVGDPTSALSPTETFLDTVAFGNGVFVTTGRGGYTLRDNYNVINDVVVTNASQCYYSSDGITWRASGALTYAGNWANLTFNNGVFVAVSSSLYSKAAAYPATTASPNSATNRVIFSVDGITWLRGTLAHNGFWQGLTYNSVNQRFTTLDTTNQAMSINPVAAASNIYGMAADQVLLNNGASINTSGVNYVIYLFASKPGVSKVGYYTGTGAAGQTVDCGFGTPARFLMIKRTDLGATDWFVWDSARGIAVNGASPYLLLNSTGVEISSTFVNANARGFDVASGATLVNASGGRYLYLAIA